MKKRIVKDIYPYESASTVNKHVDFDDLVKHFVEHPSLHHICVTDRDGKLLGLINRKKMFQNIFSHHVAVSSRVSKLFKSLTAETSGEIMITQVITTTEDASIDDVIETMIENNIREIPVIDIQNRVLGFITIWQIMQEWLRGTIK